MTALDLKTWRAALQPSAVLTAEEVCQALPGVSGAWVREHCRGATVDGQALYLWGEVCHAAGLAAEAKATPLQWITHEMAGYRLHVHPRTLARAMRLTPAGEEAWINCGSPRRPSYRWRVPDIDTWWEKVSQWRQSESEAAGIRSDGEIPTAPSATAAAPPAPRRSSSGARSKKRQRSASAGSLKAFVRSL